MSLSKKGRRREGRKRGCCNVEDHKVANEEEQKRDEEVKDQETQLEILLTQRLVVVSGLVGSDEGLDLHHVIDLQHKGKEVVSVAERCSSLQSPSAISLHPTLQGGHRTCLGKFVHND